jgi:hypothetical protein
VRGEEFKAFVDDWLGKVESLGFSVVEAIRP